MDRLFWIVREENDETGYLSPAQPFRSMPCRSGNHSQDSSLCRLKINSLPGLQSQTIPTEPFGALPRRKHCFGIFQQRPAAAIEVVEMMIVAEEHIVECTHSLGTKRRAREFAKGCRSRPVFASSGVECQVGEQP